MDDHWTTGLGDELIALLMGFSGGWIWIVLIWNVMLEFFLMVIGTRILQVLVVDMRWGGVFN